MRDDMHVDLFTSDTGIEYSTSNVCCKLDHHQLVLIEAPACSRSGTIGLLGTTSFDEHRVCGSRRTGMHLGGAAPLPCYSVRKLIGFHVKSTLSRRHTCLLRPRSTCSAPSPSAIHTPRSLTMKKPEHYAVSFADTRAFFASAQEHLQRTITGGGSSGFASSLCAGGSSGGANGGLSEALSHMPPAASAPVTPLSGGRSTRHSAAAAAHRQSASQPTSPVAAATRDAQRRMAARRRETQQGLAADMAAASGAPAAAAAAEAAADAGCASQQQQPSVSSLRATANGGECLHLSLCWRKSS